VSTFQEEKIQTQNIIGRMLQIGVFLSSIFVLVGGVAYLMRHGSELPNYKHFAGEPPQLKSLRPIVSDAAGRSTRALIQFGLLLLIATPFARVVFSVVTFARERDRLYVVFTSIVLLLLIFSFFGSNGT
jgi:uncharacterized membrane protein